MRIEIPKNYKLLNGRPEPYFFIMERRRRKHKYVGVLTDIKSAEKALLTPGRYVILNVAATQQNYQREDIMQQTIEGDSEIKYVIESNIPMPNPRRATNYPFDELEIGQSFAFSADLHSSVSGAAYNWTHSNSQGKKLSIRAMDKEKSTYRVWRVK